MPAKPADPVTTDDLLEAAGVTRDALYKWVAQKLLARPTLTDSPSGVVAVWPSTTLERVRFIVKKQREELPLKEIVDLVRARWPAPKSCSPRETEPGPKARSARSGRQE